MSDQKVAPQQNKDAFSTFMLDPHQLGELYAFLAHHQLISTDAVIEKCESAGPGNMNCTLRVYLDQAPHTFIVKQARPWVEKYPSVAAPVTRALVEAAFYQAIADQPHIAKYMPSLMLQDPTTYTLVLSDLGDAQDASFLYQKKQVPESMQVANIDYLQALHQLKTQALPQVFHNPDMCALQSAHMFTLPLQADNGLDVDAWTQGLQDQAKQLQQDGAYRHACYQLQQVYLAKGDTLIHGDFHPGSWMETPAGPKYLDPEFCTLGPKEFDLGVMIAHYGLMLNDKPDVAAVLKDYALPFDLKLVQAFAGVEWMRRLIGVAQVPIDLSLEDKTKFLTWSKQWVLNYEAVC